MRPGWINRFSPRPTRSWFGPPGVERFSEPVLRAYSFDPAPVVVLARLLPRDIEMQIYEAILQNAASFQSAQMVAMKNATDNAGDVIYSLTLIGNKIRQTKITSELLDMVTAKESVENN